jgi:NADPH-dependent 7-cyano-7-deazaguanine reductase QueF-like protein|tara:strand:- start:730 stop:879 length:150 start_codon:yes stop_codon:yes gene_type:complete
MVTKKDWQEKELSWLAKKQLTLVAIMSVIQVTMLGLMLLLMYINSIIFK